MDREGFRNRLKQYKQAREENPGLKYWEWKGIPKYDKGTNGVTLREKEDAFWRGDTQKMAELAEREGKHVTYVSPNNTLDEIVVTAKDLKKEQQRKQEYNNVLDLGITAAGFVPGLGEFADAADAVNQFRQGKITDGFISTAATFLPFVPAGTLRKSLSWFLDNDEISGAVKDRVEKLFLAGANKINFDPEKHFSTRITPGEKYNLRDINRLAAHLEEYKELESEIATNPKLLDEFYRRFRVIRDPESTLQTFSEAFAPWQIPTETFYTGVPQHKLYTFASADNNHFWMSSSPHLVEEFAGRNGKRAMLTTLKDLDQVTIDAKGKPYYNLEFFDREHLLSDDIVDELSKDPTIGQIRINNVIEGPDINILPNGDIADTGKISNDLVILKNRPIKSIHGNNGDFSMFFPNEKYYAEGGEVEPDPLEVLERSKPKVAGIPINDSPIESVFSPWDIVLGTSYRLMPFVNKVLPNYGPALGTLVLGDAATSNKQQPLITKKLDPDVSEFYKDVVIPINPNDEVYKQYFMKQFGNPNIEIHPASNFPDNFAADYNPNTNKIRIREDYAMSPNYQQIEAHEYGHLLDKYLPYDETTQQQLNNSLKVSKTPISKDSDTYREKQSTKREAEFKAFQNLKKQGKLKVKISRAKTKRYQEYLANASDEEILELLGADTAYKQDYLAGNIDIDTLRQQMIYAPTITAGLVVPEYLLIDDEEEKQWT